MSMLDEIVGEYDIVLIRTFVLIFAQWGRIIL